MTIFDFFRSIKKLVQLPAHSKGALNLQTPTDKPDIKCFMFVTIYTRGPYALEKYLAGSDDKSLQDEYRGLKEISKEAIVLVRQAGLQTYPTIQALVFDYLKNPPSPTGMADYRHYILGLGYEPDSIYSAIEMGNFHETIVYAVNLHSLIYPSPGLIGRITNEEKPNLDLMLKPERFHINPDFVQPEASRNPVLS